MVEEVAVDRESPRHRSQAGRRPASRDRRGWAGSPAVTLAKKDDVGDDGGAFALEGIGRQADRPDEVGLGGEILADGGILLVEREMGCDQCQHAAGLQGVDGFGEEIIVQGQLLPLVVELHVGERHVADHRVDAVLRAGVVSRKFSMRMSWSGWSALAIRPEMESISTPMKRAPGLPVAHEIAGAAARFQDRGVVGHAQAADGLVDGGDDGRATCRRR